MVKNIEFKFVTFIGLIIKYRVLRFIAEIVKFGYLTPTSILIHDMIFKDPPRHPNRMRISLHGILQARPKCSKKSYATSHTHIRLSLHQLVNDPLAFSPLNFVKNVLISTTMNNPLQCLLSLAVVCCCQ